MSVESLIRPYIKEYEHYLLETKNVEGICGFYHENAVLINLNEKKVVLGKEAIGKELSAFLTEGKSSQTILEESFTGNEDLIKYKGKGDFTTEKAGTNRFSFEQIWVKDNGKYFVYYDAFAVVDA